jgi:predicted nucleic acid-binding protein
MLFDTDVLIWVERGNERAAALIDRATARFVSVQTMLELLQCAKSLAHQRMVKRFVSDLGFTVLPLTENIGHRALAFVEQYALSSGLRAGDALVAATATENALTLATSNVKHFRAIRGLELRAFRP